MTENILIRLPGDAAIWLLSDTIQRASQAEERAIDAAKAGLLSVATDETGRSRILRVIEGALRERDVVPNQPRPSAPVLQLADFRRAVMGDIPGDTLKGPL